MLTRRQFLHLVASGVAAETLLPHCEPALYAELNAEMQDNEVHLIKRPARQNKSYGSGNFGEWTTDAQGLPCYEYLCDQTEDPFAVTPVEAAWRAPTDHTHQLGNDRITAAVSNYGHLQVRQDEGGAKFLNDFHPAQGLYGAGVGYLTDGKDVLGTYYPGNGQSFDRLFGMGYYRKRITGTNFSIDQTIYAPFGDDPVLVSEVTIASQAPTAANLSWAEYWGCQSYPFSYPAFVAGHSPTALGEELDPETVTSLRRDHAGRYEHRFERLPGEAALIESKRLATGQHKPPSEAVQEELANDATLLSKPGLPPAVEPPPPVTFLAALDEGPVTFRTSAAEFFGPSDAYAQVGAAGPDSVPIPEGLLHPAALAKIAPGDGIPLEPAPDDLRATGSESALILIKPFILEAGQSATFRFLYGYLPGGFTAAELIAKYRVEAPTLFARSCAAWKNEGIRLAVNTDPWIERETHWHSYYLRSGFTYDDFFGEHIVSQGAVYQYCIGLQTAPRDPLQHALALVYGESDLAKQVLRHTLKSQAADGSLPLAITGFGDKVSPQQPPSDLNLWLLWLTSDYVLATRDTAFLDEKLTRHPAHTVREKLDRAYRYLVDTVGVGRHGLLRGRGADWNGQIYFRNIPDSLRAEVAEHSESMMNAAMAAYVLEHYARMLRYSGDAKSAQDAANRAAQQRGAVRAQWAGKWFQRLWLGPAKGWLTEDRMWLDVQPWAILGQCATPDQQRTLAQSIDELLRKPSRIGAKQLGDPAGVKPLDWPGVVPGETKNGGVYDTLDGPLIWALAGIDPDMAYDEWLKNTRARHAEVYPNVWYGVWSGPDVYCSADSDHAGQTGYDWGLVDPEARRRPNSYRGLSWTAWPVMNMHRHAWPLYAAAKLCGIEFTESGVDLRPGIPKPQYSFRSKLVGLEKTASGYQGWYAPKRAGSFTIRIKLPAEEASFKSLTVNDSPQSVPTAQDGVIQFAGDATSEKPLRWALSKQG
jgi:hypothetical protein